MSNDQRETPGADFKQLSEKYQNEIQILTAGASPWNIHRMPAGSITWLAFAPKGYTQPFQGWKIHISAAVSDALPLLRTIIPLLLGKNDVAFKIPADLESFLAINSTSTTSTQLGKIITVYPNNHDDAFALARELDEAWPESNGPIVLPDWQLRPKGKVSLRYGTFGGGPVVTQANGMKAMVLVTPEGTFENDDRDISVQLRSWIPQPPYPLYREEPKPLERIIIDGKLFLALKRRQSTSKGDLLIALDHALIELVAIKTARWGASNDVSGGDARHRLIHEFNILRHLSPSTAAVPAAIALDAESDPAVMVQAYVPGAPIEMLPRRDRLAPLMQVADVLAIIHDRGYVHRDIKLSNILVDDDQVWLIDWELAAPIGARPEFVGGTNGYVPPEGIAAIASPGTDIYSFGGVIFNAATDADPSFFPNQAGRLVGYLKLLGMKRTAVTVAHLMHREPNARPAARDIAPMLSELAIEFDADTIIPPPAPPPDIRWMRRAAFEVGLYTRRFQCKEPVGHSWRNGHLLPQFKCVGINIGAAGVILGLATLGRALGTAAFNDDIRKGVDWLRTQPLDLDVPGLFSGNAGRAIAEAVAMHWLNEPERIDGVRWTLRHACERVRTLDLFGGRAGVIMAAMIVADLLGEDFLTTYCKRHVDELISQAQVLHGVPVWPDGEEPLLGAGHGSAGIALALALWGKRYDYAPALSLARETFTALYEHGRTPEGDMLRMTANPGSGGTPTDKWCHGSAGYLWCLLQAYGDDPQFSEQINWGVELLAASLSLGNPTYCHGLAGQLELWRMLMPVERFAELARDRSARIAAALRLQYRRDRQGGWWASEEPQLATPDLWVGMLAPATSLALYADDVTAPIISNEWLQKFRNEGLAL